MQFFKLVTVAAVASVLASSAFADTVITSTTQFDAGYELAGTNLLQSNLASAAFDGNFSREGEIGVSAFTDGVYGGQGNQGGGGQAATADASNVATFTFDGGHGYGYNISAIDTYAAWDNYRGGQDYVVSYATAADPLTFIDLGHVYNDAKEGGDTNTHANLVGSTDFLATNVQSVRFTFGSNLTAGYAGYREIEVQGIAAVPEPESYAMLLAGLGLVGVMMRRKSGKKAA